MMKRIISIFFASMVIVCIADAMEQVVNLELTTREKGIVHSWCRARSIPISDLRMSKKGYPGKQATLFSVRPRSVFDKNGKFHISVKAGKYIFTNKNRIASYLLLNVYALFEIRRHGKVEDLTDEVLNLALIQNHYSSAEAVIARYSSDEKYQVFLKKYASFIGDDKG